MREEDLKRIETTLGIQLPEAYRHRMTHFPIPMLVGNKERELWDDADALIELNQELRQGMSGGVKPWPSHLFSLGRDDGGCCMAMDLGTVEPLVWWVDRCHLENAEGCEKVRFDDWVIEFVRDTTFDLTDQGLDPNVTPEALAAKSKISGWKDLASCFGCLLLLSSTMIGLVWAIKWLKRLLF